MAVRKVDGGLVEGETALALLTANINTPLSHFYQSLNVSDIRVCPFLSSPVSSLDLILA